jgi:hypothetical protein
MPIGEVVPEDYNGYHTEDDSEYDEPEDDTEDDTEATHRPVRTAVARGYFRPQVPAQGSRSFVTQSQLQHALSVVQADMRKNAGAVRAVDKRVTVMGRRTRKDINTARNDMTQATEMMALLPMISQGSPVTVDTTNKDSGGNPIPAQVPQASSSTTMMLPLLLLAGMPGGFGGSSNSESSGTQDNNMMMLVLAMALMNRTGTGSGS